MFHWFKRRRRARRLREARIDATLFVAALERVPASDGLASEERERLRDLVTLFLDEKVFEPIDHAMPDERDRVLIAVNACLPILNLGIDAYDEWTSVIVSPEEFVVDYEEQDEAGVVHSGRDLRAGEAWERGPLVISLIDVHQQHQHDGYNVIIHECAHKLDMRNGVANGFPLLHRDMSALDWTRAFSEAYEDLGARYGRGEDVEIDPYATESPAECFAVFSEYFFDAPKVLRSVYPAVYAQLSAFYRQDPAARRAAR